MRLAQIKLSGFKSFVDATTINIPGKLVGVVGPNGCGKSNIIDAVRWVLGESRASALRGDSMQDVIFNGSGERKPVARASVELSFDNSLGKAAGQWSQYAEIAVKRVLQRDGESSYFINNTHVRRRDVQDIFLGTGLGPRAYAIIEQGMISRIIEARPEDLRVFLEEAAGISKYKERRRETENRLTDTRENLSRVEDIRQELAVQIEKLHAQAEVARRYNELSAERQLKQGLLWLLRRNEANAEALRHAGEINRVGTELEAETARLRQVESELEQLRVDHYAAGDAVNAAQSALYEANAEVSRLEAEIRHISDTRQRLEAQLRALHEQRETAGRQEGELREAARMWDTRAREVRGQVEVVGRRVIEETARLPETEQAYRDSQARLASERELFADAERTIALEQTHLLHANRVLQGLLARQDRLLSERAELGTPDPEQRIRLEEDIAQSDLELGRQSALLAQVESARACVDTDRGAAQDRLQSLERELSALDGRLLTLQRIQGQVEENTTIQAWLGLHGLVARPRLWQMIRVERGWETAIESVLRERLHAIQAASPDALQELMRDSPPAKVSAFSAGEIGASPMDPGWIPLADLVHPLESDVRAVLASWLHDCYAVEGVPTLATRLALDSRVLLVNRDGHQFGRCGVSFHAPDPADTGILARQREIEALASEARAIAGSIASARLDLDQLETALTEHDGGLVALRAAGAALKQRHHERQLELLTIAQAERRYRERSDQIERELVEIGQQEATERESKAAAELRADRQRIVLEELTGRIAAAKSGYATAEQALEAQRGVVRQVEREAQEAAFLEKECRGKIGEIERTLGALGEQLRSWALHSESIESELSGLRDEGLRQDLQNRLEDRVRCEQALAGVRIRLDEVGEKLRACEESRLACELKLQPLRDRIGELRLKEQAARLSFEQFATQLAESGADETVLVTSLRDGRRAPPLQAEVTRLTNAIAELGAINMAALEELAASQERKQFLDTQSADLNEALQTLDNAIRKIDRETRDLLQATFNSVNGHFGELFPVLFGGGEARLVMSGDEILDSGVQVIARPPGKKNSTIHLLSGGEKALTAIALIFSMFQLNPAPFCLLDEVDAPLDDANTERFCDLVRRMSRQTQFLFISHNKLTMELAGQLIGVTMQEQGVSRVVAVDIDEAIRLREELVA